MAVRAVANSAIEHFAQKRRTQASIADWEFDQ